MQPYFLPYIGYYQLMASVDKFVVFDDVNYINRGWINRNRLLLNGRAHTFTIPLRSASQNVLICDIELADLSHWRKKFQTTVFQAYRKAPNYTQVASVIDGIVNYPETRLDLFLLNSLREVIRYLSMDVQIVETSRLYSNASLKGEERIFNICDKEKAEEYINLIGGLEIYRRESFKARNIKLRFLRSTPSSYSQQNNTHVPWLSILDVLMFNPVDEVKKMLTEVEYV
jgi:hypothetical protein